MCKLHRYIVYDIILNKNWDAEETGEDWKLYDVHEYLEDKCSVKK